MEQPQPPQGEASRPRSGREPSRVQEEVVVDAPAREPGPEPDHEPIAESDAARTRSPSHLTPVVVPAVSDGFLILFYADSSESAIARYELLLHGYTSTSLDPNHGIVQNASLVRFDWEDGDPDPSRSLEQLLLDGRRVCRRCRLEWWDRAAIYEVMQALPAAFVQLLRQSALDLRLKPYHAIRRLLEVLENGPEIEEVYEYQNRSGNVDVNVNV